MELQESRKIRFWEVNRLVFTPICNLVKHLIFLLLSSVVSAVDVYFFKIYIRMAKK